MNDPAAAQRDRDPDSDRIDRGTCAYGPFVLSVPPGVTPESLDEDLGGTSWLQVGLVVDPAAYGADATQIARHIDAYIAWVMSRTGDHITLYGRDYAEGIAGRTHPVLLPLWRELA